jgi:hypothetical protein
VWRSKILRDHPERVGRHAEVLATVPETVQASSEALAGALVDAGLCLSYSQVSAFARSCSLGNSASLASSAATMRPMSALVRR